MAGVMTLWAIIRRGLGTEACGTPYAVKIGTVWFMAVRGVNPTVRGVYAYVPCYCMVSATLGTAWHSIS